jgi:hypothetical protein
LTNLKKFVIIIIEGKGNGKKPKRKKIKKVLDNLPTICYNKYVR